jgi:hypothetical protein
MRHLLGIDHGGKMIAETSEQGILLRPVVVMPVELYSNARVAEFDAAEVDLRKHLKRRAK